MHLNFTLIISYFMLYSTFGWACETAYCSISARKFMNRGFLKGPCCPIYGVGALVILIISYPISYNPVVLFLISIVATTAIEYFVSWLLETIFHIRWWDYSNKKIQLNGRVCLKNSLLFGLLSVFLVYFLNPRVQSLLGVIPDSLLRLMTNGLLIVFLLDLLTTLNTLLNFTQGLQELQQELAELRGYGSQFKWFNSKDLEGSLARLKERFISEDSKLNKSELIAKLESVIKKREQGIRYLRIYTGMSAKSFEEAFEVIRGNWTQRKDNAGERALQRIKQFGLKAKIIGKYTIGSFVKNLSYSRLFWVFIVAGILGYAVETIYTLITTGVIESHQGMLYGPFNQVYGVGAVLMVLILPPLARKNDWWLLFGCGLLGWAGKYLLSRIQEAILGFQLFSTGSSRSNISSMLFLGVLGFCFMKGIYPKLAEILNRVSKRYRRIVTYILTAVMCVNLFLTTAAVYRWSQRIKGIPGTNQFEVYLDNRYPDDFMEEIYPNMRLGTARKE